MINIEFKSIRELIKAFPDEQTCINHLEELRWNGTVVSPFDKTSKVYTTARGYKCKNTGKYFNVRTATLFDNTKVELQTWFLAIYLVTAHKKGISSLQLGRDLNVTQKTAWFMLQRIRNCFGIETTETKIENDNKLGGSGVVIEVDETIVGGKVKNMSNAKRKAITENRADRNNKTVVLGFVERGGNLHMQPVKASDFIPNLVKANVDSESVLMTDTANTYVKVGKEYAHHGTVDHGKKEYGRGIYYTNNIEGCFSLFDRMVIGTYHYISPKHIQKYTDEFVFRYNSRKTTGSIRFNTLLQNCTNRLTYNQLIAKIK